MLGWWSASILVDRGLTSWTDGRPTLEQYNEVVRSVVASCDSHHGNQPYEHVDAVYTVQVGRSVVMG